MTRIPALRLTSLAALACLGIGAAGAAGLGYPYVGLSLGESRARIDDPRITASLLGAGLSTSGMTNDENGTAFKVFGGYQINKHFAVEGGYSSLGRFGFTSTTVPAGSLTGQIKLQGLNLDLVGMLPVAGRLSVIGRIGAQYARARDQFSGTGAVLVLHPNPGKGETHPKAGLGLQYALMPSVLIRLEAEHFRINDAVGNHGGVNAVSLSLVFPLGHTPAGGHGALATTPAAGLASAAPAPGRAFGYSVLRQVQQLAAVAAAERRRLGSLADWPVGNEPRESRFDLVAAGSSFALGAGTDPAKFEIAGTR